VAILVVLLAACAPAASSPTAAPAKPTEAPKPAATTAPAAKPAASPAAAAKPAEAKPAPSPAAKAEAQPAASPAAKPAEAKPAASPAAAVKPAAKPELSTIKLGELKVAAKIPTFLADKLGYFREEGLTVEYEFFASGALALPVLTAGRVDIAHGPLVSVFQATTEGADYVMLSSTDNATSKEPDPVGMLVATNSPIQKVTDLTGKNYGVNVVNSIAWLYATQTLKKHGVDPKSVRFTEIPFPNMNDALVQGRVDAISQLEPFHTVLVSSGRGRAIAYPYIEIHPGVDLGAWTVTRQWLARNPNTAAAFTRAYNRAKEYARTHDKETRDAVIEWVQTDPQLARTMMLSNWVLKPETDKMQNLADLMQQEGILKSKVEVRRLMHELYLNPPM
jgi:NitT/TauT family transport system substrate-binding protein